MEFGVPANPSCGERCQEISCPKSADHRPKQHTLPSIASRAVALSFSIATLDNKGATVPRTATGSAMAVLRASPTLTSVRLLGPRLTRSATSSTLDRIRPSQARRPTTLRAPSSLTSWIRSRMELTFTWCFEKVSGLGRLFTSRRLLIGRDRGTSSALSHAFSCFLAIARYPPAMRSH